MPKFHCKVVETIIVHRVKHVVVEAENVSIVHRLRKRVHDDAAAHPEGWDEDKARGQFSFNVLVTGPAGRGHEKLETIAVEPPAVQVV